jgi:hypothetical protein
MDRQIDSGLPEAMKNAGPLRFELVDSREESHLRALVRATPLGGAIETTLRREPDYFHGAVVEGPFHQVLAARSGASDEIVAMATRSVRNRFVDGAEMPVGYLGGLRVREDARKGLVLARGFQKLRQMHEDGRTDFYLTTVTYGNTAAVDALTKRRAGLPDYHELGRYLTFILPTHCWKTAPPVPSLSIRSPSESELPELVSFLNQEGQHRLFFPALEVDDFLQKTSTYRDLRLDQIFCAWRDDRIVGTLAGWDQSAFKQSHIERYHGHWKWSRHVYNLAARCLHLPRFPRPGDALRNVMLALPVIQNSDEAVWRALLHKIRTLPVVKQNDSLALGLFELDPLVPLVRRVSVHCYETRVYVVSWDPDQVQPQRFNGRNVYLELGCL